MIMGERAKLVYYINEATTSQNFISLYGLRESHSLNVESLAWSSAFIKLCYFLSCANAELAILPHLSVT